MFKPYNKAQVTFDLVEEIGQEGNNSKTYTAFDHQLNAEIVIKQISKASLHSSAEFFSESKSLYASAHPNVVQVHYACEDGDSIFIAMPYYRDGSVQRLMDIRYLKVREIVNVGCQVLSALHNIHSKRLIHFDVKPDNILLSPRSDALLSDFGLAKQTNFSGIAYQDRFYLKSTPPEAMVGDQFDLRFDIYQFGVTLYRMCNGNAAFLAQFAAYGPPNHFDRDAFRFDVRNGRFPDRAAFKAHIPEKLRKIIKRCIEPSPTARFPSALDVANALADVDDGCLDWSFSESPASRVWVKNEGGTILEFTAFSDARTECFKTTASGQRRRFGEGCRATATEREIRNFLRDH
jgi:eukaryotic-like serine/threonine-protein kinase